MIIIFIIKYTIIKNYEKNLILMINFFPLNQYDVFLLALIVKSNI